MVFQKNTEFYNNSFSFQVIPIIHVICGYSQALGLLGIIFCFNLHKETWTPWSLQSLTGTRSYLKLGISTTVSMCAEWFVISFFYGIEDFLELKLK